MYDLYYTAITLTTGYNYCSTYCTQVLVLLAACYACKYSMMSVLVHALGSQLLAPHMDNFNIEFCMLYCMSTLTMYICSLCLMKKPMT